MFSYSCLRRLDKINVVFKIDLLIEWRISNRSQTFMIWFVLKKVLRNVYHKRRNLGDQEKNICKKNNKTWTSLTSNNITKCKYFCYKVSFCCYILFIYLFTSPWDSCSDKEFSISFYLFFCIGFYLRRIFGLLLSFFHLLDIIPFLHNFCIPVS